MCLATHKAHVLIQQQVKKKKKATLCWVEWYHLVKKSTPPPTFHSHQFMMAAEWKDHVGSGPWEEALTWQ